MEAGKPKPFDQGVQVFPPRPKITIPPGDLDFYEQSGLWVAQPKYNGSRIGVHVKDGVVTVWDRHGGHFRSFSLSSYIRNEILSLPGLDRGIEYWLDGELLIKTSAKDTKNKIIFFDVLKKDRYLFLRPNQLARLEILDDICGHPRGLDPWREMGYIISDNLLMAPTFEKDFSKLFHRALGDEVEGLVLRKKDSSLDNFGSKQYEASWLVRCRKPHKNYDF